MTLILGKFGFYDKHNMVAFLEKSTEVHGFSISHRFPKFEVTFACPHKEAYECLLFHYIKQFWRSAEATTNDNGEVQITATIDGHSMSITEASLRRHLKLDNQDGISSIPNSRFCGNWHLWEFHN
ncbi:hypothetical protein Tco_0093103 [Tanacetum coccineum]